MIAEEAPMAFKRILAATDFSPDSQHAVDRAAHIARQLGAELRVVHALPEGAVVDKLLKRDANTRAEMSRGAEAAMDAMCRRLDQTFSIMPSWAILYGRATRTILEAQAAFRADLLVIGARGENPAMPAGQLGGTSLKLMSSCKVPLLLVRRPVEDHYRQLLVAVDNSDVSIRVLDAARTWLPNASCHVVHAFEAPFATRLANMNVRSAAIDVYAQDEKKAQGHALEQVIDAVGIGKNAQVRVVRGDPTTVILAEAGRIEPDLIILGKHGAGWVDQTTGLGSTVLWTTYGTRCDLLQVP
jgi:nucleotide-binding universal stress UspA family protein